MRVFLIRHGETVDNVAGVYAGSRDSELTNHGIQQARRLGEHLATTRPCLTHIFTSPLQRAYKTADALRAAQPQSNAGNLGLTQVSALVEQDFGFFEGKQFYARPRDAAKSGKEAHYEEHKHEPGFVDVESKEALAVRGDTFLDDHLLPLLRSENAQEELTIGIVSHGILLSHLWRCILRRLPRKSIDITPEVTIARGQIILEHLGGWANTGYLEILIRHRSSAYSAAVTPSDSKAINRVGLATLATGSPPRRLTSPGRSQDFANAPSPDSAQALEGAGMVPAQSFPQPIKPGQTTAAVALPTRSDAGSFPDFQLDNDLIDEDFRAEGSELDVALPSPSKTILPTEHKLPEGYMTTILTINGQEHLRGLKRTRGGIGRARYDEGQKTIETFFKRAKKD